MYTSVYRIKYNFKSCFQNLNLHVKPKILITASEVSSSGHEDPLPSLENATLKNLYSILGCKKKKNQSIICCPLKFEFSNGLKLTVHLECRHNIYIHIKLTKNPMHWSSTFFGVIVNKKYGVLTLKEALT